MGKPFKRAVNILLDDLDWHHHANLVGYRLSMMSLGDQRVAMRKLSDDQRRYLRDLLNDMLDREPAREADKP